MYMRNNSEIRRALFNELFRMATGEEPKVHYYSQVVEFMRKLVGGSGNIWEEAIEELLIHQCWGTVDDYKTLGDAKYIIQQLIDWEVLVATDPRVNGGYKLVKVGDEELPSLDA